MESLLLKLYPPTEIFVFDPTYEKDEAVMSVRCFVPESAGYAIRPIPYLTAENYVRILSQACYLLAHHVLESEIIKIDRISADSFLKAMKSFELYYRNLSMTFHRRVAKGEEFEMILRLTDLKEVTRLSDFVLFTFQNDRTAISGEMSFIYQRS